MSQLALGVTSPTPQRTVFACCQDVIPAARQHQSLGRSRRGSLAEGPAVFEPAVPLRVVLRVVKADQRRLAVVNCVGDRVGVDEAPLGSGASVKLLERLRRGPADVLPR